MPEHEREARQYGMPSLGEGKLFAVPREHYVVPAFPLPGEWPFGAGMDPGWAHPMGIVWGARCPTTDTLYVGREWRQRKPDLAVVASVLRSVGTGYPIFGDRSGAKETIETQGRTLYQILQEHRVFVTSAGQQDLETGVSEIAHMLMLGQLKIMDSCPMLLQEMGLYHRNEKTHKITEEMDDLIDAMRYLVRNRYAMSVRSEFREPGARRARLMARRRPGSWRTR